jgi:uncharacterized protein YbjT (DUF2867 family)
MFTIFGANGHTGSIVAARLLDAGKQVRVVARDAAKVAALAKRGAEVVIGDVIDAGAVTKALSGAEGAYLLLPPDNASSDLLARAKKIVANYVAGLRGVPHSVLLSSVGAELPSGTGPITTVHHAETELPASGAKFTFLRAAYFMENTLANAQPMKQDGVLPVFGGGEAYPFTMVATRDIGETAAAALLSPPAATRVQELAGPREYSMNDVAEIASKILGRTVKTLVLPIEQLVPTFTKLGFSPHMAGLYREMIEAFGSGRVHFQGQPTRGKIELTDVLRAGLA